MPAELTHNAGKRSEFPRDRLPEIAILGRSNVGKSSLINALLGRRSLARTSGRPGKTRRIHFYRVDDAFYLVDLPGYGYAAVAHAERKSWRELAESYLRGAREPLCGAILLVDLRRGPEEEEQQLLAWLAHEGISSIGVCTKSDRLSPGRARAALRECRAEFDLPADRIAAVSSRTGKGLAALVGWIDERTGTLLKRADGTHFS